MCNFTSLIIVRCVVHTSQSIGHLIGPKLETPGPERSWNFLGPTDGRTDDWNPVEPKLLTKVKAERQGKAKQGRGTRPLFHARVQAKGRHCGGRCGGVWLHFPLWSFLPLSSPPSTRFLTSLSPSSLLSRSRVIRINWSLIVPFT